MLITNGKGTICFMRIQQIRLCASVVQIQSVSAGAFSQVQDQDPIMKILGAR